MFTHAKITVMNKFNIKRSCLGVYFKAKSSFSLNKSEI